MTELFDNLDSAVVKTISERPETLQDAEFIKAAAVQQVNEGGVFDARSRTPVEVPLADSMVFALNLGLLAEYFETELYSRGLRLPGLIPNDLRTLFVRFLLNEVMQREIILTVLGSRAVVKPEFDFTARRRIPNVFSSFDAFAGLAQSSEDLGVRAYKGQAPNVQADDFVLTTALRFHSVEARHASELRRIRGNKGWITLNNRGNLPAVAQPIYDGEENTTQLGVNVPAISGYSAEKVSEAFDEPLTGTQVLNIQRNFIRGGIIFPGETQFGGGATLTAPQKAVMFS